MACLIDDNIDTSRVGIPYFLHPGRNAILGRRYVQVDDDPPVGWFQYFCVSYIALHPLGQPHFSSTPGYTCQWQMSKFTNISGNKYP